MSIRSQEVYISIDSSHSKVKIIRLKEYPLTLSNDPNIFNIDINQNSSSEKCAPDNRVFVVTELIVSRIQALFTRTIKVTIFFHRLKMGSIQPYGGVYT